MSSTFELTPLAIRKHLTPATATWLHQILVLPQTTSTNDDAWQLAESKTFLPAAVFAESQTQGRGQHGRHWHTAYGKGLYFSLVFQPDISIKDSPRLALATAVAVASSIRATTFLNALIKPPNDILIKGQKTAGILIETKILSSFTAVIGIGLNVLHTLSDFPQELQSTATSLHLAAAASPIDRSYLAGTLLNMLYDQFQQAYANPTELHQSYKRLLDPAFEVPKLC